MEEDLLKTALDLFPDTEILALIRRMKISINGFGTTPSITSVRRARPAIIAQLKAPKFLLKIRRYVGGMATADDKRQGYDKKSVDDLCELITSEKNWMPLWYLIVADSEEAHDRAREIIRRFQSLLDKPGAVSGDTSSTKAAGNHSASRQRSAAPKPSKAGPFTRTREGNESGGEAQALGSTPPEADAGQVAILQKQLRKQRRDHEKAISRHEGTLVKEREEKRALKKQLQTTKKELADVGERVLATEQYNSQKAKEVAALQDNLARSQADLSDAQREVADLRAKLANLREHPTELSDDDDRETDNAREVAAGAESPEPDIAVFGDANVETLPTHVAKRIKNFAGDQVKHFVEGCSAGKQWTEVWLLTYDVRKNNQRAVRKAALNSLRVFDTLPAFQKYIDTLEEAQ